MRIEVLVVDDATVLLLLGRGGEWLPEVDEADEGELE
jgi:hypothetical protein